MCHLSCITFGLKNIKREEIASKRILEIGSCYINGSLRPIIENLDPIEYIGVDMEKGPGVDLVMGAEELIEKFGKNYFDVVISTELLEHVKNWQEVISNIKNVCKPNGIILVTTRSYGFPYHPFPEDYWRYEAEDMKQIFSDCEIIKLEKDNQAPGVFVKLKKPAQFVENDLNQYYLYNIFFDQKINSIKNAGSIINFRDLKHSIKRFARNKLIDLGRTILKKLE